MFLQQTPRDQLKVTMMLCISSCQAQFGHMVQTFRAGGVPLPTNAMAPVLKPLDNESNGIWARRHSKRPEPKTEAPNKQREVDAFVQHND